MPRKLPLLTLLLATAWLAGIAKDASALVTFNLIWTASTGSAILGTSVISGNTGDVLTLSIRMTTDQTLAAHGVSINFDTDLGNELNLVNPAGGAEWVGTSYGSTTTAGSYAPLVAGLFGAVESTSTNGGRINTFESGKSPSGAFLPTGSYIVGTVRFKITGIGSFDGPDVWVGLFNTGVDDVLNNNNAVIAPSGLVFGTATLNIPESGTASLLALGLVGLVLASRRGRW